MTGISRYLKIISVDGKSISVGREKMCESFKEEVQKARLEFLQKKDEYVKQAEEKARNKYYQKVLQVIGYCMDQNFG